MQCMMVLESLWIMARHEASCGMMRVWHQTLSSHLHLKYGLDQRDNLRINHPPAYKKPAYKKRDPEILKNCDIFLFDFLIFFQGLKNEAIRTPQNEKKLAIRAPQNEKNWRSGPHKTKQIGDPGRTKRKKLAIRAPQNEQIRRSGPHKMKKIGRCH